MHIVYIVYFVEHRFHCPNVYMALDKSNDAIRALEIEMATLAEQASLFDVNVPDFKQLKMCRKDVKMLKVWNILNITLLWNVEKEKNRYEMIVNLRNSWKI